MTVLGRRRPAGAGGSVGSARGDRRDPFTPSVRSTEGQAWSGTDQPRGPWAARLVTYGLVLGLALGAVAEVEHWPVTSFRLFSVVRTDRAFGLELVAVDEAGGREPIRLTGGSQVVANASHQLQQLRSELPAVRHDRVLAWMALAGMDPARYRSVHLERVERRLDPDGGPATDVRRTVVVEVVL